MNVGILGSGVDVLARAICVSLSQRHPVATLVIGSPEPEPPKFPDGALKELSRHARCDYTSNSVTYHIPRNRGRSSDYKHGWLSDS